MPCVLVDSFVPRDKRYTFIPGLSVTLSFTGNAIVKLNVWKAHSQQALTGSNCHLVHGRCDSRPVLGSRYLGLAPAHRVMSARMHLTEK